jgi:hypothetical protein
MRYAAGNYPAMVGLRFARLLVIAIRESDARGHVLCDCICDCGARKAVRASDLRSGKVKSCGCLHLDNNRLRNGAKGKHWRWRSNRAQKEKRDV